MDTSVAKVVNLIGRAATRADRRLTAGVGAHDLTISSCGILLALHDRGATAQQPLREMLGIDKNAMVGLTDRLEERGWVRRARSTADRRVHVLSLTDRGRRFVADELVGLVGELDDTISASLSEPDRQRLCDTLEQAVGNRVPRRRNHTGGIP